MPFLTLADGCPLYVEEHGWAGSPIVLLEGLGGDARGWDGNLPHLAARHRVIAYDHRGNGRSCPPPPEATMEVFAGDLLAVMDDRGLDRAHLYGMSMGGKVALEVALTRPHRVRSLILAATNAGRARASRVAAPDPVPKDQPFLSLYSEGFVREHPELVEEHARRRAERPRSLAAGRVQWRALRGWDVWDRLGEITCPTLVLHGTGDRLTSVRNAERMAEAIPGAELCLLEGAGHAYHLERPDAADAAVLAFLDRVDREGG